MNSKVFPLIKKKCPQDTETVNKLLVSAFAAVKKLKFQKNSFLANFLLKDDNRVYQLIDLLKREGCSFSLEDLIELFECVLSPQEKAINGAVYTPQFIREYIVKKCYEDKSIQKIKEGRLADISCGCGAFLLTAAQLIHKKTGKNYNDIIRDNLFGFDIADYALERTKILLSFLLLEAGEAQTQNFNLYQVNSLTYPFKKSFAKGFDLIVGNPPYVCSRKMSEKTRKELTKWTTCHVGHPDLYVPFFQIALENLKSDGIAAYITVNSFFKSLNGRKLRQYFQDATKKLDIIDFGYSPVFKDKQVYTCICFFSNKTRSNVLYKQISPRELDVKTDFQCVPYNLLNSHTGWNLNKHTLMTRLESCPYKLGALCQSRHGIATLKNSVYIFSPKKETNGVYIFENKGKEFKIEKELCREIINSNKISSNSELETLKEIAIFPYEKTNTGLIQVISEQKIKTKYRHAYKYLLNQKESLESRDKGRGQYPTWFAYGRTQSLNLTNCYKLFFPKITRERPNCVISKDKNLLFYNGQAFIASDLNQLKFIQKILCSSVFGLYIRLTSKPYSSGYYSLNGNYIKNFSIPQTVLDKKDWLINQKKQELIDKFLIKSYLKEMTLIEKKEFLNLLSTDLNLISN